MPPRDPGETSTGEFASKLVRVAATAIPILGQAAVEALAWRSAVKQRRFNDFVESIEELFRELGLTDEYGRLRSCDAFGDYFEEVYQRAVMTDQVTRLDRLRDVLVNRVKHNVTVPHEKLFLQLIAELDDVHIDLLREYYLGIHGNPRRTDGLYTTPGHYSLDEDSYSAAVIYLRARGLFLDDGIGTLNYVPDRVFRLSPLGLQFLNFLKPGSARDHAAPPEQRATARAWTFKQEIAESVDQAQADAQARSDANMGFPPSNRPRR